MFLRPSSAHYTYRPAASPVRDRRAYKDLPASFYNNIEPDFDLNLTSDYTDGDLAFRASSHSDTLSAEARYRRALEEARAAKEEILVQAEEVRLRNEALALQSEVARLRAERAREEARLNQIRLEEARLAQVMREEARMIQAAKERERRAAEAAQEEARRRELVARRRAALIQQERARVAVRQLFEAPVAPQARPQARSQPQPQTRPITLADLLARSLGPQESPKTRPQPIPTQSTVNASAPAPAPKAHPKAEESPEQVNMKEVYDFIYNLFGPQGVPQQQPSTSAPAPAAAPKPLDKGKGKAAPEPTSTQASQHDILKQRLEERLARETEQEMADTARAILNSLRDQHAEASATSSKVQVENAPASASMSSADLKRVPELSGNAAQNVKTQYAAHRRSTSAPAAPTTPLERIQSIRATLTSLRTSFHFPATPEYNDTTGTLTYSAANTPLRAYEHALNELLEQLDGIESEGDVAVRGRRREVVKEVEQALEEFDERVRAASPVRSSTPQPVDIQVEAREDGVKVEPQEKAEMLEEVQADPQEVQDVAVQTPAETVIPVMEVVDSAETVPDADAVESVEPIVNAELSPAAYTTLSEAPIDAVVPPAENSPSAPSASSENSTTVQSVASESIPDQDALVEEQPVAVEEPAESVFIDPSSVAGSVAESSTSTSSEVDATSPVDLLAPVSNAPAPTTESEPPSGPQPESTASESFLTSLSHDHFAVSPAPRHHDADVDELEDSVLIEKEDNRDSEHSWSEVESDSA